MSAKLQPPEIPYVDIVRQHAPLKKELLAAVEQVLDRGSFILGPQVGEFERQFAKLVRANYAVGLNSGTDALILALRALNVGSGDEVITAVNSFVASASCAALVGATPVLVDVRSDYNIDPDAVAAAITPRTKAIIPVHLTGRPAEMDTLMALAHKNGLYVIEDAAQAIGASYRGQPVGSFGDISAFSLHPLKTLNACGDGGVAATRSPELADRISLLRNLGLRSRDNCVEWSGNSRLDTIQAAMLLVKLKHLEAWTEKRRENASFYREQLRDVSEVQLPDDPPHMKCVFHTFVLQVERRDRLREFLRTEGVGTQVHYPNPIHLQDCAIGLGARRGAFPVAERQAERIISLPIYPELSESELVKVVTSIRRFYAA